MPEENNNVNFARLVDWMEGRLPEDEAGRIEETVAAAGEDTLADVAWLHRFFAARDVLVESPPRRVRDVLMDAFEDRAEDRRTPGLITRSLAGLSFDSNLQPAAGLRAIGAERSRRQLIYRADEFDLAINLLARDQDNDLELDGQVLPREREWPEFLSAQLLLDGSEHALTIIDELGSFAFEHVPPGVYELVLSADDVEISVAPLDVGL